MNPMEAKFKNWTLSNNTYIRFNNTEDRKKLQEEIVSDFAKRVFKDLKKVNEKVKAQDKKFKINAFNFGIFINTFLASLL